MFLSLLSYWQIVNQAVVCVNENSGHFQLRDKSEPFSPDLKVKSELYSI